MGKVQRDITKDIHRSAAYIDKSHRHFYRMPGFVARELVISVQWSQTDGLGHREGFVVWPSGRFAAIKCSELSC